VYRTWDREWKVGKRSKGGRLLLLSYKVASRNDERYDTAAPITHIRRVRTCDPSAEVAGSRLYSEQLLGTSSLQLAPSGGLLHPFREKGLENGNHSHPHYAPVLSILSSSVSGPDQLP